MSAQAAAVPRTGVAARTSAGKRLLDVVLATMLLIIAVPILSLIAVVVSTTSRGPVIYRQERFGRGGRRFTMYKFRTMVHDADDRLSELLACPDRGPRFRSDGKLRRDPRVTVVGRALRRTSLDELPQLVNVLRGDMSLVGPRPLRHEYELAWYGDGVDELLSVPPGITGLWQVSGRNDLPTEERVSLDLQYVDQQTLLGDVEILVRTVPVVVRPSRSGAY